MGAYASPQNPHKSGPGGVPHKKPTDETAEAEYTMPTGRAPGPRTRNEACMKPGSPHARPEGMRWAGEEFAAER
jgi:hypothetical protein